MRSIYSWIEYSFALVDWASITLVCIFFFRRRLNRIIPEFANYIILNAVIAWVANTYFYLFQLYHLRSLGYFYFYSVCDLIEDGIALLTIYLIFARLLRGLPSSRIAYRTVPAVATFFLIIVAVLNFMLSNWPSWTFTKRLDFIHENFALLQCGLVFFIISVVFLAAIPWEKSLNSIVVGFGIDSSLRLAGYALCTHHSNTAFMLWPAGRVLMQIAGTIAPLFWFIVFLSLRSPKQDPKDRNFSEGAFEPARLNIETWIAGLEEVIYRRYKNLRAVLYSIVCWIRQSDREQAG